MSIHDSPGGALGSAWFGLARLDLDPDPESTETETQLARSGSIDLIPPGIPKFPTLAETGLSSAQLNSTRIMSLQCRIPWPTAALITSGLSGFPGYSVCSVGQAATQNSAMPRKPKT